MKRKRSMSRPAAAALAAIVGFGMGASPGQAAVSTSGCAAATSCTLAELFAGGSISVDETEFRDWSLSANSASAVAADPANIIVTGIDADPITPTLAYDGTGEWVATGSAGDFSQTNWTFVAEVLTAAASLQDNSLTLGTFTLDDAANPSTLGSGGTIDIQEEVCPLAGCGAITDDPFALKSAFSDNGVEVELTTDEATFPTQERQLLMMTDVYLAVDAATNLVALDSFEQRFSLATGPVAIPGDLDGDGNVDRDDLNLLLSQRNQPASGPGDPADLDGDGRITALDARRLATLCDLPGCTIL